MKIIRSNQTKILELKNSINEVQNALEKHWKWRGKTEVRLSSLENRNLLRNDLGGREGTKTF